MVQDTISCVILFLMEKETGKIFLRETRTYTAAVVEGIFPHITAKKGFSSWIAKGAKKRALVKAKNPRDAAYKTFAHEIIPIDEMGEENAVFFGTMPIVDPPYYVGSTIDEDFPDGLKCGMYLPRPGTDSLDMLGDSV